MLSESSVARLEGLGIALPIGCRSLTSRHFNNELYLGHAWLDDHVIQPFIDLAWELDSIRKIVAPIRILTSDTMHVICFRNQSASWSLPKSQSLLASCFSEE